MCHSWYLQLIQSQPFHGMKSGCNACSPSPRPNSYAAGNILIPETSMLKRYMWSEWNIGMLGVCNITSACFSLKCNLSAVLSMRRLRPWRLQGLLFLGGPFSVLQIVSLQDKCYEIKGGMSEAVFSSTFPFRLQVSIISLSVLQC